MKPEEISTFNDLCSFVVYHYGDCSVKIFRATRRLIKQGVIDNVEDIDSAYAKWEEMYKEYVSDRIPAEYQECYDYWGGKCFSNQKGWNAPKSGFLAGENGRFLLVYNFEALEVLVDDFIEGIYDQLCETSENYR